jgi:hypothetical protein
VQALHLSLIRSPLVRPGLPPARAPFRLLLYAPPLVCEGWGYIALNKEADMAIDGQRGSLNRSRQSNPTSRYGVPRYRVTLVREGRAIPAAESIQTSAGAALLLRPLFAGLDGNNSSSAALMPSMGSSDQCRVHRFADVGHCPSTRSL